MFTEATEGRCRIARGQKQKRWIFSHFSVDKDVLTRRVYTGATGLSRGRLDIRKGGYEDATGDHVGFVRYKKRWTQRGHRVFRYRGDSDVFPYNEVRPLRVDVYQKLLVITCLRIP